MSLTEEAAGISKFLSDAYKDIAAPSLKILGRALGAVTWMFIGRHSQKFEFYQAMDEEAMKANLKRFAETLAKQEEGEIHAAPPEIAKPIIDRFAYVTNDEVAKMYCNLLASAASSASSDKAHPSFVQIIDQLSPDEALLLRSFKDGIIYFGSAYLVPNAGRDSSRQLYFLKRNRKNSKLDVQFQMPSNVDFYFEHLLSLGLVEKSSTPIIDSRRIREMLEEFGRNIKRESSIRNLDVGDAARSASYKIQDSGGIKWSYTLSAFGLLFLKACLPEHFVIKQSDDSHENNEL